LERINQTIEGTEDSQASVVNTSRQGPNKFSVYDLKEKVEKMADTLGFPELKVLFGQASQKLL